MVNFLHHWRCWGQYYIYGGGAQYWMHAWCGTIYCMVMPVPLLAIRLDLVRRAEVDGSIRAWASAPPPSLDFLFQRRTRLGVDDETTAGRPGPVCVRADGWLALPAAPQSQLSHSLVEITNSLKNCYSGAHQVYIYINTSYGSFFFVDEKPKAWLA